jgi:N-acetyl-alpha-D-muramate 1-phosphate uridylyltransferase
MELSEYSIAVLAGGLATRLRPITLNLPKSLISFHGKPFLEYQINLFKKQGFHNILLCVGHQGEKIEEFFGSGDGFGVKLSYSYDGAKLLGTGGALRSALPRLSETFIVVYGDSFLDIDYALALKHFLYCSKDPKHGSKGLMTVYKNHDQFDKSNIVYEKGKIVRYDKEKRTLKMEYIDWGLGVFSKSAFDDWEEDQAFDLAQLYQKLLREKKLVGFEVDKRFYEIGSHEGKEEFLKYIEPDY